MTGTGTISFQNIPVAAPSGVNLAGARQGLLYNAGYIELGNPDISDSSSYINVTRYIVLSPGGTLWVTSTGNSGWMADGTTFTILRQGRNWEWIRSGGRNIVRVLTDDVESGIEFYNNGAPSAAMAFVGYEYGVTGGLRFRTESGFSSNTIEFDTSGGDMIFNISGNQVLRLTGSGNIYFAGPTNVTNSLSVSGSVVGLRGGLRIQLIAGGIEVVRVNVNGVNFSDVIGVGGVSQATSSSWINIAAGTSAKSQLRLNPGVNVTSSIDGDVWYDGTDIFMNIGGTVKTFQLI